jgi:hypothetical protein
MSATNHYIPETDQRIADRDRSAEIFMHGKSGVYRATAGAGLKAADTLDRINGVVNDPKTSAMTGFVKGALRGAAYGAVLGLIGIMLSANPVIAVPVFLGAVGASSALGAALGSWRDHNDKMLSGDKRHMAERADHIAQAAGALPMQLPDNPDLTHEELLKLTGRDPALAKASEEYEKSLATARRAAQNISPAAALTAAAAQEPNFTENAARPRPAALSRS